ncbi:MAG: hypothetical protein OEZ32_08110 [Nitrospinota bacterium]|nr:hypothetical protein [Nitrospinota bacterium]
MEDRETAAPEPTETVSETETEDQTAIQADETTVKPAVEEGETTGPDSDEKTEETQDEDDKPRHQKSRAQKRIETLAARNRHTAEENVRLREKLEAAEKRLKEMSPPIEEDFGSYEEYQEARVRYEVDSRFAESKKEDALNEMQARETQANDARHQVFAENLRDFKEVTPDFDEVVNKANVKLTQPMIDSITGSLQGPEMLYYLSQNPGQAAELVNLSPIDMAREMGKLEARLEASPPKPSATHKPISKAPPPVKPLPQGSSASPGNMDSLGADEYVKHRIAQLRGAGR